MKTNLCVVIVSFVIAVPMVYACRTHSSANQHVQALVVSVQKHEVQFPGDGSTTPTDAPLSSRYYAYDVSVRIDCNTYVGRYETAFDYLPSAFTPGQPIQVRMARHIRYFDFPDSPELKIAIVHHATESGAALQSESLASPWTAVAAEPHEAKEYQP